MSESNPQYDNNGDYEGRAGLDHQHTNQSILEQEIKHEQTVVDRIYLRLEAAARSAKALEAEGHSRARLGNESGLVERDAIVFQAARRLANLDAAHDGLVFGRLDFRDGKTRYIGRLGLRDADREVLLVDWRAPVASVFYQATAQDPHNVVRRRVLTSAGETVVGVEDDLLDAEHAPDDLVVVGEGALLASLSRARDRSMHSVVATIQKEQDDAIRAPHRGVTTISGGPGTGKTVVALHRAAFLLYSDRRRFEGGGVLVIGPSSVFMHYIERVLPSLGETSVVLRAVGEVVDGVEGTGHDIPGVAAVKGSVRMKTLLARTARGPVPGAPTTLRVFYRDDVLTLDAHQLATLRRELLSSGQRRNKASGRVHSELLDALWKQVTGDRARSRGKEEFANELLSRRDFTDFARDWWPIVDAVDVLGWLHDRERLTRDAHGLLAPGETDDLLESWGAEFSVEDVPLLDELRYLLGDPPEPEQIETEFDDLYDELVPEVTTMDDRGGVQGRTPRPTQSIEDDSYAHVLVDEAQDLSPMQWRMVGRRGRRASWTVVGDPAQSSWPVPDEAAAARAEALAGKDENAFRLSTNYRNSAEIYHLAADVARSAIPGADLPNAVRRTGIEPALHAVEPPYLAAAVQAATVRLAEELEGTVGVVVPVGWRDRVDAWLGRRDIERIPVLEALDTKGLEFDGIVVVEPDHIVDESPAGIRTLYVVLTRATQRLDIVGTSARWDPRG